LLKRVGKALGIAIGLLGVLFVGRELIRNWEEVARALLGADALVLLAAFLFGLLSMASIGLAWRRCLTILDVSRPRLEVLRSYFVGQLGKYVPGGIWPVVGRAEMARRDGVDGAAAYGSTVLSMSLTYLAAALVAIAALLIGAGGGGGESWWPVLGLLTLGLVSLHPLVAERGLRILRRVSSRDLNLTVPSWGTSILLLVRHVPAWLGISVATWLVAHALDPGAPDLRNIVYATSLAWLVGFVAVGVPGGIGVREAVFLGAAVSLSSPGVAAAVTVVARVVFIGVDVIGAALTSMVFGLKRQRRIRQAGQSALPED
jgi:glycosyltransferase 2 family protein